MFFFTTFLTFIFIKSLHDFIILFLFLCQGGLHIVLFLLDLPFVSHFLQEVLSISCHTSVGEEWLLEGLVVVHLVAEESLAKLAITGVVFGNSY
jgi:hypothetical protein